MIHPSRKLFSTYLWSSFNGSWSIEALEVDVYCAAPYRTLFAELYVLKYLCLDLHHMGLPTKLLFSTDFALLSATTFDVFSFDDESTSKSPTALHAIALETINTRFPPEEWLHIYTDGSLLDFAQVAGIGVFSHLFSFYLHAGPLTTHFDDSTSALQALSNYNENNCLRVQNCRELLGKIKGKIVFQWVPSHCGLWGNERADFLAKRERVREVTLCKKSHGIPSSPRAAAVAKFRLLTGHDCLCAHLFRFNLVTSPICVLCDTGQDMTAVHLDECSALNDLNCIVKRAANWSQCSLYPASNQRAASKLSVKSKNPENFPPRRSTIATPPRFHRSTNRHHATQQKGKHHSHHAPHQKLVMIWD
ncbi:uncharacterized protein LOC103524116 [Trichonephila clavipes]|nr:uncharacterized protein LOC103524116 [Trichonephila clavipes]